MWDYYDNIEKSSFSLSDNIDNLVGVRQRLKNIAQMIGQESERKKTYNAITQLKEVIKLLKDVKY